MADLELVKKVDLELLLCHVGEYIIGIPYQFVRCVFSLDGCAVSKRSSLLSVTKDGSVKGFVCLADRLLHFGKGLSVCHSTHGVEVDVNGLSVVLGVHGVSKSETIACQRPLLNANKEGVVGHGFDIMGRTVHLYSPSLLLRLLKKQI